MVAGAMAAPAVGPRKSDCDRLTEATAGIDALQPGMEGTRHG